MIVGAGGGGRGGMLKRKVKEKRARLKMCVMCRSEERMLKWRQGIDRDRYRGKR